MTLEEYFRLPYKEREAIDTRMWFNALMDMVRNMGKIKYKVFPKETLEKTVEDGRRKKTNSPPKNEKKTILQKNKNMNDERLKRGTALHDCLKEHLNRVENAKSAFFMEGLGKALYEVANTDDDFYAGLKSLVDESRERLRKEYEAL